MGDVLTRQPRRLRLRTEAYETWLAHTDGTEKLLSLGPMTLVKPLMEKHATYEPVIMGGCVHTPPNFNGFEFNQSLDRDAFSFCTRGKHAAVTLDTCRTDRLDMRKVRFDGDDLYARIIRADQALSITRGEDGCYVWDDVAAACLLHPDRFVLTPETDKDGNRLYNAAYVSDKPYYET